MDVFNYFVNNDKKKTITLQYGNPLILPVRHKKFQAIYKIKSCTNLGIIFCMNNVANVDH